MRFHANLDEALRLCLHSRLAMRVLWPVGEFDAPGAEGLYQASLQVPWEEHLDARTTFAVEATVKNSEHNHTGFVALKVKDGLVDRLREKLGSRPDVDTHNPQMRIVAHLNKNKLSLSLDVCGEPLNRRGYRVAQTEAPLKENLAAAILRAANYTGEEPLCDPMCGSGTIVIEAGLIATRRAPGLARHLGIEKWPFFKDRARPLLEDLRREARAAERKAPFPLIGRDRDEEALAVSQKNASAAGLKDATRFELADAMNAPAPEGAPGLLCSNPPYGDRLTAGGQKGMKTFYFKLGDALKEWHGWRLAMLVGNTAFESAFHARPIDRKTLWNGPIECELYTYGARQ